MKRKKEKEVIWSELVQVMKDKNITNTQLAEKLDVHLMTISQYRTGKRIPNLDAIRSIAAALEVSPKELV